jgi:hypothetical protein
MTLLVVCAAMALDILAPWSESYSVRQSLVSRFGHPAFVVVGMALVAALPLYRIQWRRSPLCAAAPLVIGSLSVGVGLTYYIVLARENAQALNALNAPSDSAPILAQQSTSTTPISPQLGLYLFILIGVVLVVAGYQLFLAAVRSQYVIIAQPQMSQRAPAPMTQPIIAPVAISHNGVSAAASIPRTQAPAAPAPTVPIAATPMTLPPMAPAVPVASQPVSPATPPVPAAPVAARLQPAPAQPPTSAPAQKGLVLPGTDAWNEESVSPVVNKQSRMRGGWRYSSR